MKTHKSTVYSCTVFKHDLCSAAQIERKENLKMARFTNQAELSYNGTVINSNVTVGEIVESLSVEKIALVETYTRDSEPVYIINLVNSSSEALTGLVLSDDLGAFTVGTTMLYPLEYAEGSVRIFVNGDLILSPDAEGGPPLNISGITVPAGAVVTIVYKTAVTDRAPLLAGGTITNTATVRGSGLVIPVTASDTIRAAEEPEVTITKSLVPSSVSDGDTLTYTFVIENHGNTAVTEALNVILRDTFLPVLECITVTYNDATQSSPEFFSYSEATGVFATVPGKITVPSATYERDPVTGAITVISGKATLTVSGTVRV